MSMGNDFCCKSKLRVKNKQEGKDVKMFLHMLTR